MMKRPKTLLLDMNEDEARVVDLQELLDIIYPEEEGENYDD